MKQETLTWITDNYDTWQAICRVNGKLFKGQEVMDAFHLLLRLAKNDTDFDTIFTFFLTEYEHEFPFFNNEKAGKTV